MGISYRLSATLLVAAYALAFRGRRRLTAGQAKRSDRLRNLDGSLPTDVLGNLLLDPLPGGKYGCDGHLACHGPPGYSWKRQLWFQHLLRPSGKQPLLPSQGHLLDRPGQANDRECGRVQRSRAVPRRHRPPRFLANRRRGWSETQLVAPVNPAIPGQWFLGFQRSCG